MAELITALREEALGVGQPDPMPGIITKVVNEVRSCIGFCPSTVLDLDATKVPANLKDMIVQKIVRTMKGRLLQPLSDDETTEEKVYQVRLVMLTQCEWPVDTTDTPISTSPTQAASGGVELASNSPRRATPDSLGDLL
ncbi:MAG: hypothetical protein Q8J78_05920 [Moraxellaceae bacterium]|nr:hypothetical protein [Moraxellaceae bacterium]